MLNGKIVKCFVINIIASPWFISASPLIDNRNSTLQLVHVIFRHGERTTDRTTLYPKDPYINETYYPYGLGELTNAGKKREYRLGKTLRQRYGHFLDDIYTPDILEARSSDSNRTKASLQLVLAGLFPPKGEQLFELGLNWQPIPYSALPLAQDRLFFGILCPNFKKHLARYLTSPRMVRELKQHEKVFRYISENSGRVMTHYQDAFFIYMCLLTEEEYGLKLPEWTKKVYPQPLRELTQKSYELLTATTDLRRMASGYLLQKILDDTRAKIQGESERGKRKIYLYSGHEMNLAFLFTILELNYKRHIPPYGSYLAIELHKIDGVDGFKMYYQNSAVERPELVKLPGCDQFCPVNKFMYLTEEFLPSENTCTAIN